MLYPPRPADGGEGQKRRWIVSANATPDATDDAIRAKADAAAATLAGHNRHSISTDARDPWFASRPQHRRTFLRDQPPGRASPTRAAAAACGTPDGGAPTSPAPVTCPPPVSGPRSPAPGPRDAVGAGGQGQCPQGPMDSS